MVFFESRVIIAHSDILLNATAKARSACQDLGALALMIAGIQHILANPVVVSGRIAFYTYSNTYAEPKLFLDKNKAQKDLRISDLTTGLQGIDQYVDEESLVEYFDFGKSNVAFKNAAQRNWDALRTALDIGENPKTMEDCRRRFDAALEALRLPFCQATCKPPKCDCSASKLQAESSPLDDLMNTAKVNICTKYFSWEGIATEVEFERLWPRHVDQARSDVRKLLADKFPSPALIAISAQEMLVDYVQKITTNCEASSSWWNPLGVLAHAVRNHYSDRVAVPRDIITAKTAQIRRYVHDVMCPALRRSMCRAGCEGPSSEDYCAVQGSTEQRLYDDEWVVAVSYRQAYCKQMQDFARTVRPVCDNVQAAFGKVREAGWSIVNLAFDAVSVPGIFGLGVMISWWADPSQMFDINQVLVVTGALRSATYLFGRMAAGWKNASKACDDVARSIASGGMKTNL